MLGGFGADGINQEDEQLGDESDYTVLERHCQLVVTVAYPRACRPHCAAQVQFGPSEGTLGDRIGDPGATGL